MMHYLKKWLKHSLKQSGFALIESMISMLIISIGLLAAVKLYMDINMTANDANRRLAALKLLNLKIEDLKQFETLETTNGMTAFQDIGNNTGGTLQSGTYNGYTLLWCVDTNDCHGEAYNGSYYYAGLNAQPSTTNSLYALHPDFKKVKVIVTWQNESGQTKSVSNETLISSKSIEESGFIAAASTDLGTRPTLKTTPNTDTDTNQTAKPLPDGAVDNGDDTSTFVQNSVTYLFDNTTGNLISINHIKDSYNVISGTVLIDAGKPGPKTNNVDNIHIYSTGTAYCIHPFSAGSGSYSCYYAGAFSGYIYPTNISSDVSCPSQYSFLNVEGDAEDKNFFIRKSDCNY